MTKRDTIYEQELGRRTWGMNGEALPDPDEIVFYADGSFLPFMFHFAIEGSMQGLAGDHGFDLITVEMADQLGDDDPLVKDYLDGLDTAAALRRWDPGPLDGWRLVGKVEAEDGPMAIYLQKREASEAAA